MIDGHNLGLEKGTGVATYARNLSHEIHNLGYQVDVLYGNRAAPARNPLLQEIAFFDSNAGTRSRVLEMLDTAQQALLAPFGQYATDVPLSGQVIARSFAARMPYHDRILNAVDLFGRAQNSFHLWNRLTSVTMERKPDLMHWTYPLPIRLSGRPNIYTLHDLVPLRLPYTTLDNKKRYFRMVQKIARTADHIVTVSESARQDLIDILGMAPERITNTYQSVDIPEKYRNKPEEQVIREVEGAVGVGYKGYYLFWGSIEPKKNIGRMIEAYLSSKVEAPLVIVGAQAWKAEEELRLLNDENITFLHHEGAATWTRKRVLQLPYAPFPLLVSLIRGARAALFPSLYEGFGLPALEAMLLGTPVITSNTASLPEVAGDAAIMVDPYDTAALAQAIRQMDADADLRAELAIRGQRQARKFTPEIYRERLEKLYAAFV